MKQALVIGVNEPTAYDACDGCWRKVTDYYCRSCKKSSVYKRYRVNMHILNRWGSLEAVTVFGSDWAGIFPISAVHHDACLMLIGQVLAYNNNSVRLMNASIVVDLPVSGIGPKIQVNPLDHPFFYESNQQDISFSAEFISPTIFGLSFSKAQQDMHTENDYLAIILPEQSDFSDSICSSDDLAQILQALTFDE